MSALVARSFLVRLDGWREPDDGLLLAAGDTRFDRRAGTPGGAPDDKKIIEPLAEQPDDVSTGVATV